MANRHGEFIWYELATPDADAAAGFYGAVIGWNARAMPESPRGYRIFGAEGAEVAGLMPIPPDGPGAGMPPGWLGYVGVEDVDAAAAAVLGAGGAQTVPPTDIPGVGRFAMLADPQGAPFYVMRGLSAEASRAFAPMKPGHCNWNELTTTDQAAALDFYAARFGWERGDAMPMGEMGDYQFIQHHGVTLGAMMTGRAGGPPPAWTFYFGVRDIDVAARAVSAGGGAVLHGPVEVPGDLFIILARDPQGAGFGLVGPRNS